MIELSSVPLLDEILENHQGIKAVLFDMDGTFINTEGVHSLACREFLVSLGPDKEIPPADWFQEEFTGLPDSKVFDYLVEKGMLTEKMSVREFLDEKSRFFIEVLGKVRLEDVFLPDIKTLLVQSRLRGLKAGLVTASEKAVMEKVLAHFELASLFDVRISRDDTEIPKPDPQPYLHTMGLLGVKPEEVVIFEDSETGLASAMASGGSVYKVSWY